MGFYEIDDQTKNIVLELVEKAKELNLGNVNFRYYIDEVEFHLKELNSYWQLIVSRNKTRDTYKIANGTIVYEYSETDRD